MGRLVVRYGDDICPKCNIRKLRNKGKLKDGTRRFGNTCEYCHRNYYSQYKKDKCEKCGFIPEDMCQLDVDHIDGNHDNDNPLNLQTLCANCHRLKTKFDNKNKRK